VCETASVHLAAAMANFVVMESAVDPSPFKTALADLRPGLERVEDSFVSVPDGSGLGLAIDWDAVARLRTP
jgi:L-alanine-DL-glutamate epimerase-like enolase superfamily enzyme